MQSLACASPFIQEDFILLECDHIFEKRALSELLANDQDTCLLSRGMSNEGMIARLNWMRTKICFESPSIFVN